MRFCLLRSRDGKLCLLCDYSDRDGRLEGCDVYIPKGGTGAY